MLRSPACFKEHADGNAFGIAEVYAFRGQSDEAMHWLERAYAQKDAGLYFVKGETAAQESRSGPPLQGVPAQDESAGVARDPPPAPGRPKPLCRAPRSESPLAKRGPNQPPTAGPPLRSSAHQPTMMTT